MSNKIEIEVKRTNLGKEHLTINAFCNNCKKETKHNIVESITQSGSEEQAPMCFFSWSNTYQIISCNGCEGISFRNIYNDDEHDPVRTGPGVDDFEYSCDVCQYPEPIANHSYLQDCHSLPGNLCLIYLESSKALNKNMPILAGIGIRAIIETVAKDNQCSGENLFGRIDSLVSNGVLTVAHGKILHKLRALGNKSAHDVKPHSLKTLVLAMDVIDHLLQGVYLLPASTADGL